MEFTPYQQHQIQKIAGEECEKRSSGCLGFILWLVISFVIISTAMSVAAQRVCPIEEKLGLPHMESWWLTDITGMSCKVKGK